MKFSKDGKFIKEWGKKGSGPGEISEPHTIAMDSRGRLFVGDRENNRIQIFDQDGKYITEWRQFGRPSGIYITRDDTMYVADSESGPDTGAHELMGIKKGIRIGSAKDGTVTAFIEDMESTTGDHSGAEGVGVDAKGNVYGAVVGGRCSSATSGRGPRRPVSNRLRVLTTPRRAQRLSSLDEMGRAMPGSQPKIQTRPVEFAVNIRFCGGRTCRMHVESRGHSRLWQACPSSREPP